MTDRHNAYVVILSENIREDDAKDIIKALSMVKGVAKVKPHVGSSIDEMAGVHKERERISKAVQTLFETIWER